MPQREFGHSPGQKKPVTDARLITPLPSNRDWLMGSVQGSKNQQMVMEAEQLRGDRQSLLTSQSIDDSVHVSPKRPLGDLVNSSGTASFHTRPDERLVASTISKVGSGDLTEKDKNEIRKIKKSVIKNE